MARWAWGPGTLPAVARVPLVPLSVVYDAAMVLRTAAYHVGVWRSRPLPGPTVAVGNLGVGGAGKTPLAAWIAQQYVDRGVRPGLLLRGYGHDESLVLARLVPAAVVVADPDRLAGAREAARRGAEIFVLDDAFQLLGVARQLNIALVSAEPAASSWRLPAGPWRESWRALGRADAIVVTRKRASAEAARSLGRRLAVRWPQATVAIARLGLARFEGLESGAAHAAVELRDRRVVAAAGIFDPESFAAQLRALGARVDLVPYPDHHAYSGEDLARLERAAAGADYLVVTEKDAVKLRGRWQAGAGGREPLVALLTVEWEEGGAAGVEALAALARRR